MLLGAVDGFLGMFNSDAFSNYEPFTLNVNVIIAFFCFSSTKKSNLNALAKEFYPSSKMFNPVSELNSNKIHCKGWTP